MTEEKKYRISWDKAGNATEWEVLIWKICEDGTLELFLELNKNSDSGGSFDF